MTRSRSAQWLMLEPVQAQSNPRMNDLSPERLEAWRALCLWLEARSFARVHELRDVPAELRFLLEPENKPEFLALGLVWKSTDFWQLRPDVHVRLAYFAGDPETVAGMNAVRNKFTALAEGWLAVVNNLDGLLTLERGTPSRWDTDWACGRSRSTRGDGSGQCVSNPRLRRRDCSSRAWVAA